MRLYSRDNGNVGPHDRQGIAQILSSRARQLRISTVLQSLLRDSADHGDAPVRNVEGFIRQLEQASLGGCRAAGEGV